MPRLTETRRKVREQALLDAAAQVFSARGYEAAAIADIARAAGVSDGLIYRYFTDKRALLAGVLERFFEEQIARSESAVMAETGFEPRLRALLAAHLATYVDTPEICRLFLHQQREAGDYRGSPLHGLTRRYTDLVLRIVELAVLAGEADPAIDARMLRDLIFGGTEHLAWHWLSGGPPLDPTETAARLARLFVHGVGTR